MLKFAFWFRKWREKIGLLNKRKCLCALALCLKSNQISRELPNNWNESHWQYLKVVDVSYNNLSGKILSSMGFLSTLFLLVLSCNNFYGEIPSSLQNCSLINIDLGENHFSGNLPSWIGSDIYIIRLWLNLFVGIILRQWCNLSVLHILDLAQNNLFGGIPDYINNFTTLTYSNNTIGYFGYQSYFEKN